MPSFQRPTGPEAALIKAIRDEIDKRLLPSFVVPMRQTDPPTSEATNLWMRPDGRLRGRYWNGASYTYVDYPMRTDITAPPAVPAAPAPPSKPTTAATRIKTYTATWSQSYKENGSKRTDDRGEYYLLFGNAADVASSVNGTQRSLVGFDYATIATDLAGSTIKAVDIRMTNLHAYWNSGVQIYFGMHNVTAEPTNWPVSTSLLLRKSVNHKFGQSDTRTVPLSLAFGQALRAGTGKGIAIEAPSSSRDYYGYAAGVGSGYTPPQLIVTYAK